MKVNAVAQSSNNQSFGMLKTHNLSRSAKNYLEKTVFPAINYDTVQDFDRMGYDIVFRQGEGPVGKDGICKQFEVYLKDHLESFNVMHWAGGVYEDSLNNLKRFNRQFAKSLSRTLTDLEQ